MKREKHKQITKGVVYALSNRGINNFYSAAFFLIAVYITAAGLMIAETETATASVHFGLLVSLFGTVLLLLSEIYRKSCEKVDYSYEKRAFIAVMVAWAYSIVIGTVMKLLVFPAW